MIECRVPWSTFIRYGWLAGCGLLAGGFACAPRLARSAAVTGPQHQQQQASTTASSASAEASTATGTAVPAGASLGPATAPSPPAAPAAALSPAAPERDAQPPTPPPPATGADPFAALQPVVGPGPLPPLPSVRAREAPEGAALHERVVVRVTTVPAGAQVQHHGRALGTTPLTFDLAHPGTPLDLVLTRAGYMLLRTRIERRESRSYVFELTPGKLQ